MENKDDEIYYLPVCLDQSKITDDDRPYFDSFQGPRLTMIDLSSINDFEE